jgi:hypothetical protein
MTAPPPKGASGRGPILTAALTVACAAGVATAHGLYQVAVASRVPTAVAWLYPVITDGLALVAYATTNRLYTRGRRYAAVIVILAAGLSGTAQAVYLAGGINTRAIAPTGLRFGVGAWPAAAAALTAHLLHLISNQRPPTEHSDASNPDGGQAYSPPRVHPSNPSVEQDRVQAPRTTTSAGDGVQPQRSTDPEPTATASTNSRQSGSAGSSAPARDRAQHAARSHYTRHGRLPTVTELMEAAQVARGTAGAVLKELRNNRPGLHLVNADTAEDADR